MPQYFSIHKYLLQCGAHTLACRVETSLRPPDAEEFSLASGAGLHPAGRFPTGLFVLSSPVREEPMKSARSLPSRPTMTSGGRSLLFGFLITAVSIHAADRPMLQLSLRRAVEIATSPEGSNRL